MAVKVFLIEQDDHIRGALKARLERDGYDTVVVPDFEEAEKCIKSGVECGVAICSTRFPGKDSNYVRNWAGEHVPHARLFLIADNTTKESFWEAARSGVFLFSCKPLDEGQISQAVRAAMVSYGVEREKREAIYNLESRIERTEGHNEDRYWFVSKSRSMSKVNEWLTILRREAMRGDSEEGCVLIEGEVGTDKEGIARMIHVGSRRGKGPWLVVSCAGVSSQQLESELFGHEKGAFPAATASCGGVFEIAKGGTVYVDDICDMDPQVQAKFLRAIQEKKARRAGGTVDYPVHVRVICGSSRDLDTMTSEGKFNEALYHALSRVAIDLPPLREREDDIMAMARQFCERAFAECGKRFEGFTPDAEAAMSGYSWPGNVKELVMVMDRLALVWDRSGQVPQQALALGNLRPSVAPGQTKLEAVISPYHAPDAEGVASYMDLKKKWQDSFEREYLLGALNRHGGNVSAAAREAKLDRSNFLRLLRRYQIRAQQFRKAA